MKSVQIKDKKVALWIAFCVLVCAGMIYFNHFYLKTKLDDVKQTYDGLKRENNRLNGIIQNKDEYLSEYDTLMDTAEKFFAKYPNGYTLLTELLEIKKLRDDTGIAITSITPGFKTEVAMSEYLPHIEEASEVILYRTPVTVGYSCDISTLNTVIDYVHKRKYMDIVNLTIGTNATDGALEIFLYSIEGYSKFEEPVLEGDIGLESLFGEILQRPDYSADDEDTDADDVNEEDANEDPNEDSDTNTDTEPDTEPDADVEPVEEPDEELEDIEE